MEQTIEKIATADQQQQPSEFIGQREIQSSHDDKKEKKVYRIKKHFLLVQFKGLVNNCVVQFVVSHIKLMFLKFRPL